MTAEQLKAMHYKNVEECQTEMAGQIWLLLVFAIPIIIFIEVHFCLVVWTHYKNSNLAMSEGGTKPEGEGRPFAVHEDEE